MLATKVVIFILFIQVSVARGNNERKTNYESVLNFILGIRDNSSTVWEYVATIQALLCPGQPVCTRDGIQSRNTTLSAIPRTLNVGKEMILISDIPEFVGICCLPCSCSENCQENTYCCMSREVFFDGKSTGGKRRTTSSDDANDDTLVNTGDDAFVKNVSDMSMDNKRFDALSNNASDDDFQNDDMTIADSVDTTFSDSTLEDPIESDCVSASVKTYLDKNYFVRDNLYFMVTRCFKDKSNDTLNRQCQHPRYDQLEETVPVTSMKTKQTYWNMHCAICNRDADDVIQWRSVVSLSPQFYYFANSSRPQNIPQTVEDLHVMFVSSDGDITYKPTPAIEENVCLPNKELLTCNRYGEVNTIRHKDSIVSYCNQFHNPVTFNIQGLERFYMNPFCVFCSSAEIQPARNTECTVGGQLKNPGGMIKGLLDYRLNQNMEETTAGQDLKNGKCRCTEVEDPYLGFCRPAFCAPGGIWMKCRCAQPIKSFAGIPIRLFLKLVPEPGNIDVTTDTQIRKLKLAMKRFLQNTVENTTAEINAIVHFKSQSSEYILSMATLRSNPDHDTKETMRPLLKYLDKKGTHNIKIAETRYAIQFTTRVLVWTDYKPEEGTKLRVRDLEADDVYNVSTYFTDESAHHTVQPLSPLLYCKQLQLNASEYTEIDGQVNIKTTAPTFSLPYYYRIDPEQIRVCVSHYLKKSTYQQKSNGTAFLSITGLIVFLIVSFHAIV